MSDTINVRYKMMDGHADLAPRKAHHDDAAYDLLARDAVTLPPGEARLVPTGLFLELPVGYEAQIRPRSGLALNHSLTIPNSPGTIDAGYRGEVKVIMLNAGKKAYDISRGDRVAQMVIAKLPDVELISSDALSETKRGAGGFGSTGLN